MEGKIVQISGFGVNNTINTQCDFMIVAVTESGKVVITTGDGMWADISPKTQKIEVTNERQTAPND